jgi:hypothetical protein
MTATFREDYGLPKITIQYTVQSPKKGESKAEFVHRVVLEFPKESGGKRGRSIWHPVVYNPAILQVWNGASDREKEGGHASAREKEGGHASAREKEGGRVFDRAKGRDGERSSAEGPEDGTDTIHDGWVRFHTPDAKVDKLHSKTRCLYSI